MLQARELFPLINRLLEHEYTLLMETSGERPLAYVPQQVHKIVDVKCPGSGEGNTFDMENLQSLSKGDEVKFVIAVQEDYRVSRDFTRAHGLEDPVKAVLFSPAFRKDAGQVRGA